MLCLNLFRIKGPLRFVKNQHMFRGNEVRLRGILSHIFFDPSNESLAAASSITEFILQHLYERSVSLE